MYDLSETELEKLSLILGYNASDITFGWNGKVSGLTLQYSHFTDKAVEHGHSIPLTTGLTPIVYFQNVEQTFLGSPFTTCIETEAVNNYSTWVSFQMGSVLTTNYEKKTDSSLVCESNAYRS